MDRCGGYSVRGNSISRTVKRSWRCTVRGPPTLTLTNRRVSGKLPRVVHHSRSPARANPPRELPSSLISRQELTYKPRYLLGYESEHHAHGLVLDCIFVELFCDPRYILTTSGRRPSCFARAIRGYIHSFVR